MDKLQIRLIGKKDRHGNDYYTTTTRCPVSVDLSRSVIHVFPFEETDKDGKVTTFGCDLAFRHYEPGFNRSAGPSSGKDTTSDNGDEDVESVQLDYSSGTDSDEGY